MAAGKCRGIQFNFPAAGDEQPGVTRETSTEVKQVITTHIYIYC